jgi:hypothetical protein
MIEFITIYIYYFQINMFIFPPTIWSDKSWISVNDDNIVACHLQYILTNHICF